MEGKTKKKGMSDSNLNTTIIINIIHNLFLDSNEWKRIHDPSSGVFTCNRSIIYIFRDWLPSTALY